MGGGKTREEVLRNIEEAMEPLLEVLEEESRSRENVEAQVKAWVARH